MKSISLSAAIALLTAATACADKPVYTDPVKAAEHPDFAVMGEYKGQTADNQMWGLQVASGQTELYGLLYKGGLPGDGWDADAGEMHEIKGGRSNGVVELTGEGAPTLRYHEGAFQMIDESGAAAGELQKVERGSPTMGKEAPEGAVVLFDGSSLEAWEKHKGMTEDGLLIEGAHTVAEFGDMKLHVEFKLPFMPGHEGQGRANSGVYIMNRYEVQILDSFGLPPQFNGAASLYRSTAPKINMSLPPLTWQTYDIDFRAPRFDGDGNKTENARITVRHNGVVVHDDLELESGTGAGGRRGEVAKAFLLLQDHSDPVRFRNVWLLEP